MVIGFLVGAGLGATGLAGAGIGATCLGIGFGVGLTSGFAVGLTSGFAGGLTTDLVGACFGFFGAAGPLPFLASKISWPSWV